MRVAFFVLIPLLLGAQVQTLEVSLQRVQELYNTGDMRSAEQALINLATNADSTPVGRLTAATAWSNVGVIRQDMARAADAERAYEKALALLKDEQPSPTGNQLRVRTLNNLASMYLESGQAGKAKRLIEELEKFDVPPGADAARIQGTFASYDMVRGRNREAEERFLKLLNHWEETRSAREQAVILNNLGVLAMNRSDPALAVRRLSRSLEMWQQASGNDHPASLTAQANYGTALLITEQSAKAADVLEKALLSARGWYGENSPITAHLTQVYSAALAATGRKKEAKQMKAQAEKIHSTLRATDPAVHTVDLHDLTRRR